MSHTSLQFGLPFASNRTAQKSLLVRGGIFFGLVSLADLVLTIHLVTHPSECYYESNPIASWILYTWGICGLGLYKIGLVTFFFSIVSIIALMRKDVAYRVISSASIITSCVVLYSLLLYLGTAQENELIAAVEYPGWK